MMLPGHITPEQHHKFMRNKFGPIEVATEHELAVARIEHPIGTKVIFTGKQPIDYDNVERIYQQLRGNPLTVPDFKLGPIPRI